MKDKKRKWVCSDVENNYFLGGLDCQVFGHGRKPDLYNAILQQCKMTNSRPLHPDFQFWLDLKEQALIDLFKDLREYILELYLDRNELVYHTHALTAVFSISDKLSDAFCMLPIYSNHLNLGFNKGTLLNDPNKLLTGTGKLIRHVDIMKTSDYKTPEVKALIQEAIVFAIKDMDKPTKTIGETISKIK